jgi:hypothetical protein
MRHSYNSGPCRFCGRHLTGAGFARASHEKKDIRLGLAVELYQWSWKGEPIPNTRLVVKNEQSYLDRAAKIDRFPTFEACKQYYNSQPIAGTVSNA